MGAVSEDEEWADIRAAQFHPLVADDPELAARLMTRFAERVVSHLIGDERRYGEGWFPPNIEVGVTPRGVQLLRINFAGSEVAMEWDGSVEDAEDEIDSEAERQAYDATYDYWIQGEGWKQYDGGGA
jgi:hypothetical protein